MLRKSLLLIASFGLALALAVAQPFIVSPTTGEGQADAYDKGFDEAVVTQTVILRVPAVTALHLDVTELMFDMTPLDGALWPDPDFDFEGKMVCVYGPQATDKLVDGGFFGQQQVLPLGTFYGVGPGWPDIEILNFVSNEPLRAVTSYPPIQFDAGGELVPGSKDHFVCYRTFILQKFSNGSQWQLTVERTAGGTLEHIYIQDNPCDTFGLGTGFYELLEGQTLKLVPTALGTGPTGARSAVNPERCGFKSWLDDLVVVAVKVNADQAGDNAAVLRYTLKTDAWW